MFYWIENSVRRLRRYFSRSEWAIRHFCLPVSENTLDEPGLLLIQIDGLSRYQMERAMRHWRLPFLRSLVRRRRYELHTFYSGIPSATPAVQGELHFGVPCAVPAFSFLDRASNRVATMYKPDWARTIEHRLQQKSHGVEQLLAGGSSWSNIYSGGAAEGENHFCAVSIGPGNYLKAASRWRKLGLGALHLPAIVRLTVLLFVELFIGMWDLARGVWRGQNLWKEVRFLCSRIFICIGVREAVTAGAKIDLARGLPVIHVNYLGYDEQSHCRGPGSAYAHWSLRGIDAAIRSLYWAAQRSARRDYHVWIFSDHGQEPVRSFAEHFPGGIEKAIVEALQAEKQHALQRQLRSQQRQPWVRWRQQRHVSGTQGAPLQDDLLSPEEQRSFTVTAMGPVANVYFAQPMEEARKRQIAGWLVHKRHVPGTLLKTSSGRVIWIHRHGIWRLPEDAEKIFPHPGPLKLEVARDLAALCQNEFAGDLLLVGWSPQGPQWSFPVERGSHGGPGVMETQGFALLPLGTQLPQAAKHFIRPFHLRQAALHVLGRKKLETPSPQRLSATKRELTVITYNVHGCQGLDGRISPRRIARAIAGHQPDIVALQEIDLGRARSHRHDQSKRIAELLGMHVVFCSIIDRGGELYGHALLSRFPMEVVRTGQFNRGLAFDDCEPRGALLVRGNAFGNEIYLLNTHLGLGRAERLAEIHDLLGPDWVGSLHLQQPLIACGDFNMLPGSLPYRAIVARLHDAQLLCRGKFAANTFPASLPLARIDHVFVSGHFEVDACDVPRDEVTRVASDHLPLLVRLRLERPVSAPMEGSHLFTRREVIESPITAMKAEAYIRSRLT